MSQIPATIDLAESLLDRRHLVGLSSLFYRAEACGADADRCASGRWMAAMLSGDFEAAWHESDAIRRRGRPDPNRFWNGEPLAGKRVMIRCLHGYGDAIQFLRYAPKIRKSAAHLAVECAQRAVDLIRCLPGIDEVTTWGADASACSSTWHVQMEVMEIAYIIRSTITDLPIATNYLRLPCRELDCAARALAPKTAPRIGIVWSAGDWNPSRSLPLHALLPILRRTEFEFWNLQGGSAREEWRRLGPGPHLRDTPLLANSGLVPLAAFTAHLDLVITVDTLAAHLAGALGIPCFLALQYAADWRWMVERNDSPWYPSLRLFRQPCVGDWAGLVRGLDRALTSWLLERSQSGIAA